MILTVLPREPEPRTGRRLCFVYRRMWPSLHVAERRLNTTGRAVASRSKTGLGQVKAPIFFLVPKVMSPRRLDRTRDSERAHDTVRELVVANWIDKAR